MHRINAYFVFVHKNENKEIFRVRPSIIFFTKVISISKSNAEINSIMCYYTQIHFSETNFFLTLLIFHVEQKWKQEWSLKAVISFANESFLPLSVARLWKSGTYEVKKRTLVWKVKSVHEFVTKWMVPADPLLCCVCRNKSKLWFSKTLRQQLHTVADSEGHPVNCHY